MHERPLAWHDHAPRSTRPNSTNSTRNNWREVVRSLVSDVATKEAVIARHDAEIERRDREIAFKQAVIDRINHEMAVLKRLKFAARSEH